jgi:hypothetical protein
MCAHVGLGTPQLANPNRTLYISKIPPNQNTIPALIFFFKKYGHIESASAEGTSAVVAFDSEESARAAFQDPNPFLNNRFIRIYFHKTPANNESNLDQFINRETVVRKVSEVQQQIDAKLREQEAFRLALREQTAQKIRERAGADQNKIETLEELKKQRTEYVLAASRLVSGPGSVGDANTKETLQALRRLIDETHELIQQLQRERTAASGG